MPRSDAKAFGVWQRTLLPASLVQAQQHVHKHVATARVLRRVLSEGSRKAVVLWVSMVRSQAFLSHLCCDTGGPRSSDSGSQLERGPSDLNEPRSLTLARNPAAASDPAKPKVLQPHCHAVIERHMSRIQVSSFWPFLLPAIDHLLVLSAACGTAAAFILQFVSAALLRPPALVFELCSHARDSMYQAS